MGAIETAKEIANLVLKYNDVDVIRRIVVLEAEIRGILQQIAEKDEAIEKLKRAMELKSRMVCEYSAYYQVDERGNKIAGPFCTNCFDNEYAARRLLQAARPKDKAGHDWEWVQCPKCKVPFRSKHVGRYLRAH
jgi:hypothetical protein